MWTLALGCAKMVLAGSFASVAAAVLGLGVGEESCLVGGFDGLKLSGPAVLAQMERHP